MRPDKAIEKLLGETTDSNPVVPATPAPGSPAESPEQQELRRDLHLLTRALREGAPLFLADQESQAEQDEADAPSDAEIERMMATVRTERPGLVAAAAAVAGTAAAISGWRWSRTMSSLAMAAVVCLGLFLAALLLRPGQECRSTAATPDGAESIVDALIDSGDEASPSLAVTRFEGSDAVHRKLIDALTRCDWFAVRTSAGDAEYTVAVRHTTDGQESMELQVVARKQGPFVLRAAAPIGRTDEVVYRAVDALLSKAFSVPGLCSSRIAFAAARSGGLREVYTCRFDGSDLRPVTRNGSISTEPTWGGNGQALVYMLYQNNATSVVQIDMASGRQELIGCFPGANASAALSPDAQWAAITLSKDSGVHLFVLSVRTGQIVRQLTSDLAVESSPCWSPRGDQICYVSDRDGKPQLLLVSAGGGSSSRLLQESDETVSPDWSAVSNKVCFAVRMGNEYAIGLVDMADSARERKIITNVGGSWESPSWAPDGRHIVCSRRVQSRRELYMVDTWHRHLAPITKGGDHSLPSWSSVYP